MRTRLRGAISGGSSRPVAVAGGGAKFLDCDLLVAREIAHVWCQGGTLEVRKSSAAIISTPPPGNGCAQRAVGADQDGGTRQARPRRCRAPTAGPERRGRKVDQHGLAIDDEHVRRVEPAVRDPGGVETRNLLPQALQGLVAHLVAARVLERLEVRPPGDDEGVAIRR